MKGERAMADHVEVLKIDEYRYRIPRTGRMITEGLVFASDVMMAQILQDKSLEQVANVACLPGIVGRAVAMPDIHWGYGFPIGGVAAFDLDRGVVSPGGVGYDINCGVRLMRTSLRREDLKKKAPMLVDLLFSSIPSGVGSHRKDLKLSKKEFDAVLATGARWAVEHSLGDSENLDFIEEHGVISGAEPDLISKRAFERGKDQLGTLGSGNHFIEVGYVAEVFDEKLADGLRLYKDHVTVLVHTGSRGLGHQICDDYIVRMLEASRKYGIELPDRQLCCAPVKSPEGEEYLHAMACAANFGFANREIISHWVCETFMQVFHLPPRELGLRLVYDVAHNVAKIETHLVEGEKKKLCVHRKGATRALPANHRDVPSPYKALGQPVLVPGDMGRASYVLIGGENALAESWGSACHGAGRVLSRSQAKKVAKGRDLSEELKQKGIIVRAASQETLAEELPDAYKDISQVVEVMHGCGICRKVVKLKPLAVIKG
jgi:tRNA-splicing ligase RtcB (3'-phosphate/5'-hydroxy nucleic acid ligase)